MKDKKAMKSVLVTFFKGMNHLFRKLLDKLAISPVNVQPSADNHQVSSLSFFTVIYIDVSPRADLGNINS